MIHSRTIERQREHLLQRGSFRGERFFAAKNRRFVRSPPFQHAKKVIGFSENLPFVCSPPFQHAKKVIRFAGADIHNVIHVLSCATFEVEKYSLC